MSDATLRPGPFSSRFAYTDNDERNYVVQVVKLASNDRTRIHLLADEDRKSYGFIALSIDVSDNRPSLVIDYLFTSLQHRGVIFSDLGAKISDYLIGYSVQIAELFRQSVPLRYISLHPATLELDLFYRKRGFTKLDSTDWLFLRF